MPLVFIHGVNTRDTDPDYFVAMSARRKQFEDVVAKKLLPRFPKFRVLRDIYWGDLGVKFRWKLTSIPETRPWESLGPGIGDPDNPALLEFIGAYTPDQPVKGGDLETLGSPTDSHVLVEGLAAAAKKKLEGDKLVRPGDIVRAVFTPEARRFDRVNLGDDQKPDAQQLSADGEQLALLLRAASIVADRVDDAPALLGTSSDAALLDKIQQLVYAEYAAQLAPAEDEAAEEDWEHLGKFYEKAKQFAVDELSALIQKAKGAVASVRQDVPRAATLVALQKLRDQVSQRGLRFLGDVFVYLHGSPSGEIVRRIREGILAAAGIAAENEEPLVVVTHSFGTEIFYETLTNGDPTVQNLKVALWASAGAQTSLFAEMALFGSSDPALPNASTKTLAIPHQVTKWINFYDAADVLSYLHAPVFAGVTDIEVRNGADLSTAHGHYFLTPKFYEEIRDHL